ncbi:MAG: hypothetical protein U0522_00805 [Candidatus Paceibacterota bacterium]
MVKNIKEGIIRNRSLLFFALAVAVLFGGMLFVAHSPGVEGKGANPTVLSCTNNTPNGGICVSNSQCQSGLCVGVNGIGNPPACTAENVGTCQITTIDNDGVGGIQDYTPTMSDGDGGNGGGGKEGPCTNDFPVPPTWVSGSFSGSYVNPGLNDLNITIPPAANNGTGEEHQVIVILNNQEPEDVSVPIWVDYPPVIPAGYSGVAQLQTPTKYQGEPIKIAVRNWDSCQGLWSEWRQSGTITQSGGGGLSGSCNGNVASNSVLCSGDNAGFSGNIQYDLVQSCSVPTGSAPKCERECDIGYVYSPGPGNSDSCVPAPTYSCTGTLPANSTLCAGDGTGLTADTPYTTVASCSSPSGSAPKCEAKCQGNTEPVNGQCVENEIGNIFGYAWSDNIGWIQMNSCFDEDQDGVADSPCATSGGFGVSVNNGGVMGGSGTLSGHAWSDSVGWINFGGLTGPNNSSDVASLTNIDQNVGSIAGWARVLSGDSTPGFDGWIKLSDNTFPTGYSHEHGDAGLTYNRKTARIMGSMWGGEALGWIRFNDPVNGYHKVTYGVPAPFDYSITALPSGFTSWTVPGETHNVTSDINLTLTSGKTETVDLSVQVNAPGGATSPLTASLPANASCKPDCQKTLSINVSPDTDPGMYEVIVKGQSSIPEKTVTIPVLVPSFDLASCKAAGGPPYLVNNPVTWVATPATVDPLNPLTYSWEGTNVNPTSTGSNTNFVKTYATTGIKELYVTATNVNGVSTVKKCDNSIVVVAQPDTNEF